uniref:Uncharacterized protein n=1 Tax=Pan troglodytes TaxID=9598 RepID=A0A2I3SBL4_PANTR
MDFLRLYLPGLHQALRGALDSLGTFVSYLLGDAVPTVEREAQAAEELGAVAVGKTGKIVEEEAQEDLEGLRGSQNEGAGRLRGPGDDRKREVGSPAVEQTWGWGDGSSHGSQAERQDSGAGETAKAARCQEPSAHLEARKKSKAGSGACQDRSGQAQERQESHEQEVNREERLRSWEQEEEEEEVRAREPGMARGAESEWTWHGETEGKGWLLLRDQEDRDKGQLEMSRGQVETEEPGPRGWEGETEVVGGGEACESTRAWGCGAQGPRRLRTGGILGREEVSGRGRAILDRREARTNLVRARASGGRPGKTRDGGAGPRRGGGLDDLSGRAGTASGGGGGHPGLRTGHEALDDSQAKRRLTCCGVDSTELWKLLEALGKVWRGIGETRLTEVTLSPQQAQCSWALKEQKKAADEPRTAGGSCWEARAGESFEGQVRPASKAETWEIRAPRQAEQDANELSASDGEAEGAMGQARRTLTGEESAAARLAVAQEPDESELSEVPEAGGEGLTTQDAGCGTEEGEASVSENQELDGSTGADAGPCPSLGEAYARETEDEEAEADRTSRRGWSLQAVAVGLPDREDAQTGSVAAGIMGGEVVPDISAAGAGEALEGAHGQGWDSREKEEAAAGEHAGGQEFGLEGSAEEEVTGRGSQVEAFESREGGPWGGRVEAEESAGAEDSCGLDPAGSQTARAEGMGAMVEAGGLLEEWTLLEEEAVGWQEREQREDSEGQCGDYHPEGEAPRLLDAEGLMVTGGRRAEAKETEPESLEHVRGQEEQPTHQAPAEAAPESVGEAETAEAMGSARGGAANSWSEAPLPGSLLDVSVPRSRVHLSRSSSQRHSRPSFRRTPAWEQQEEPPAPNPPEEELSAPEQRPLQLEEPLEPSPLRHDGTPVPARRRSLGHG